MEIVKYKQAIMKAHIGKMISILQKISLKEVGIWKKYQGRKETMMILPIMITAITLNS
jgi:hypothetical protein